MISYKSTKCKLKNVLAKRAFVRATLALLTFQKLVKLVGTLLARLAKDNFGIKNFKQKDPQASLKVSSRLIVLGMGIEPTRALRLTGF